MTRPERVEVIGIRIAGRDKKRLRRIAKEQRIDVGTLVRRALECLQPTDQEWPSGRARARRRGGE